MLIPTWHTSLFILILTYFSVYLKCVSCVKLVVGLCFSIQPDKFCLLIRIFRALTFNIISGTFGFVCHLFHLFSVVIYFSLSLSLSVCVSLSFLLSFSSCLSIYPFSAFFSDDWRFFSVLFWFLLEKEMATHSSVLAWRIPWTEEPGGLQSMGSQRVGYDWATSLHLILLLAL